LVANRGLSALGCRWIVCDEPIRLPGLGLGSPILRRNNLSWYHNGQPIDEPIELLQTDEPGKVATYSARLELEDGDYLVKGQLTAAAGAPSPVRIGVLSRRAQTMLAETVIRPEADG